MVNVKKYLIHHLLKTLNETSILNITVQAKMPQMMNTTESGNTEKVVQVILYPSAVFFLLSLLILYWVLKKVSLLN